jgi:imidazolonepropionase-like amidohydrolase
LQRHESIIFVAFSFYTMRHLLTFFFTTLLAVKTALPQQSVFPFNGIRDDRNIVYAFRNARLFQDYRTAIDSAVLIIKEGKVLAAGKNISIPEGAVVFDLRGMHIYPSFIDLFSNYGLSSEKKPADKRGPQFESNIKGAYGWNQAVRPETDAARLFDIDEKKALQLQQAGFGLVLTHQQDGIVRGSGVLVSTALLRDNKVIIKDSAAAFLSYDKGSSTQEYPGSLMGAHALLRQTYLDGQWYAAGGKEKEFNLSLDAWNRISKLPVIFDARDKYEVLMAARLAAEYNQRYIIKTGGDDYQRLDEIAKTNMPLILPLNFPEGYDVTDPYDAMNVSLRELKHWETAPANPYLAAQAKIPFALTAHGLKDLKDFLPALRKAVRYGLSKEEALKALTVVPASMAGIDKIAGTLQPGMRADFFIATDDIFKEEAIITEHWTQGERNIHNAVPPADLRGTWTLRIQTYPDLKVTVKDKWFAPKVTLREDTSDISASVSFKNDFISLKYESKDKKRKGAVLLTAPVHPSYPDSLAGSALLPDGSTVNWSAFRTETYRDTIKKDTTTKDSVFIGKILYPNSAYGFEKHPQQEDVLFRNATVWTCEKEGVLENTDVLISKGKIVRIGKNITATPNAKVIDASGKHLSPGIIDEHSHIAVIGNVNECTHASSAEVRIGDVLNPDDINIYRQLAGGVTSAHLLHGSCNPIGGQTQLIKLRWGKGQDELKFENWPGFIKFALGENVKQSNWGDLNTIRYPQTRMGVEQIYVQAFTRALEYERDWKKFNEQKKKNPKAVSPRKDLELEALLEIIRKKRFITCHSYVQSEINMLMKVAESFGFTVNTFTHILEGYKVADKMKHHGAAASSFSDWWAYKYEVMEAIPHNGSILNRMGIVTAFNSDDAEMARRLNQEAAKGIKYGGMSREDALKLVTLNPAIMMHVGDRTGSIKIGKDADLVLWDNEPLSVYARVIQTYVDGICYYDSQRDEQLRREAEKERQRLITKMLNEKDKGGGSTKKPPVTPEELKHCMDDEDEHF